MRCYQHFGLAPEAKMYLEKNCMLIPNMACPECGHIITNKKVIVDFKHEDVFYGDGPTLHTYLDKNGKRIKEVVQDMPWSSGPCGFLCLELEDGTRIGEWTKVDIDHA